MSKNEPSGSGNGPESKGYKQQASEFYNRQYDQWVPWAEDQYLKWFSKDNKASYTAKQQLDQTKITGNSQVDNLQDGVNGLVSGQLGQGGLGQGVGDKISEGITEGEQGKTGQKETGYAESAGSAVKGAGQTVGDGVGKVGSGLGGLVGGGKK